MTARILECSEEEYFAHPALDFTTANRLITYSPMHCRIKRETTEIMENGKIMHALILGAGDRIATLDFPDFRTKDARAKRDELRAQGIVPILRHKYDDARVRADRIAERLEDLGVYFHGKSEMMVLWEEEAANGNLVQCKGMLDHFHATESQGVIYDLKIVQCAHPRYAQQALIRYGYAMQCEAYTRAIEKLHPDLAGRVRFEFLFCEDERPFGVLPASPTGTMRQLGRLRWERAVNLWERCTRLDDWPGYACDTVQIEAPAWALAAEEDEQPLLPEPTTPQPTDDERPAWSPF